MKITVSIRWRHGEYKCSWAWDNYSFDDGTDFSYCWKDFA